MAIPVWEGHHHSQFLPLSGWRRSFWSRPVDPDRQKEPFGGDYIAILRGLSEWGDVADPFIHLWMIVGKPMVHFLD